MVEDKTGTWLPCSYLQYYIPFLLLLLHTMQNALHRPSQNFHYLNYFPGTLSPSPWLLMNLNRDPRLLLQKFFPILDRVQYLPSEKIPILTHRHWPLLRLSLRFVLLKLCPRCRIIPMVLETWFYDHVLHPVQKLK